MQKITPFLWFDNKAEEAVNFYTSVFSSIGESASGENNTSIKKVTRYGKEGYEIHGMPEGTVMTMEFEIAGQTFAALNGGPHFKFNEAISFVVNCETQEETDYYWEKLSEGGDPDAQQCGWLKDKFGVSWQIVPTILPKLLADEDVEKVQRVTAAMLKMKKIIIEDLEKAYNNKLS